MIADIAALFLLIVLGIPTLWIVVSACVDMWYDIVATAWGWINGR